MQMEGYSDRIILQKMKEKFYPEAIYWAREVLTSGLKKQAMAGQAAQGGDEMGQGQADTGFPGGF